LIDRTERGEDMRKAMKVNGRRPNKSIMSPRDRPPEALIAQMGGDADGFRRDRGGGTARNGRARVDRPDRACEKTAFLKDHAGES
jgi:hypothetical protein